MGLLRDCPLIPERFRRVCVSGLCPLSGSSATVGRLPTAVEAAVVIAVSLQ